MQSFHSCFILSLSLSLSLSLMQDGGLSDGFANHPSAFFYPPPLFLFYSAFLYMDRGNCRQGEDFFPFFPEDTFLPNHGLPFFRAQRGGGALKRIQKKKAAGRVRTSHFANIQRVTDDWRKRWNMGALDFFCFGSTLSVQSSSPEREKKTFFQD